MDAMPEYSLFLVRILEELDTKYSTVSYQDLCKSLCARFDLVHLAKLRSLLFYTACLDPAFPATLFKDKMRCSVEDQQSKKLMVAADIVTMFNLIQMNGGMAKDKLPMGRRPKFHKNQSFESCRSDTDVYKFNDNDRGYNLMDTRGHHVSRKSPCPKSDCNNCQQFIPTSEPNFLLGVTKDLKCRAASLDKLQHLPQYSSVSPPPCEMQSTYFPMDIDSESTTDQESLHANPGIKDVFVSSREPFTVHSCMQKRNVFKEDFHNLVAFSPHVITTECRANPKAGGEYHHRRELSKPPTFFNHSFELPYSYNSNGSLSQVTKSDRDSSPDQNTVKLGKTGIKLDRLFQSLENSDDELKESVCKLVLRIGEIEKKLESLSGVRGEISQVLSKLTRLDEKIQEPEANGKSSDNGHVEQVKTDANLSPHVFQCHTTGHNMKVEKSPEWCCSEADGSEILRVKALKKSMFIRRSSRSLNEDNSATESKVASINNSPRDWRTVSYSGHTGDEGKENDRHSEGKDRHRKPREIGGTKCTVGRTSSKHGKQPAWPVKSLSLNTEEGPDFERSFLNGKVVKDNHRHNISTMENDQHFQCAKDKPTASPSGFPKKSNGTKTKEMSSVACGPSVEKREVGKRYKDKSVNSPSFQSSNVDNGMSVGTQTEQPESRKAKDYSVHNKYGERPPLKHSDEDSEMVSDDISDIFRFLDDMSVCGSLGVVQSSCYNSN
ncbi:UPF0258 protein KIAA1024-like, partial [Sinocyclocheilus grahami]|uniref:UPF0258 protein KIAA1024-like n=1 Tax=Sinocyclocheilus grahami TaxID=75366 RepID=UPI0007ACDBCE